jgi:hypothetical protein
MVYFRKVERAKSIIENGKEPFLKECGKCKSEFYGARDQSSCGECNKKKRRLGTK